MIASHDFYDSSDFNEDDYIDEGDLKRVIRRLCGEQKLSEDNVNTIITKVCDKLFHFLLLSNFILCLDFYFTISYCEKCFSFKCSIEWR